MNRSEIFKITAMSVLGSVSLFAAYKYFDDKASRELEIREIAEQAMLQAEREESRRKYIPPKYVRTPEEVAEITQKVQRSVTHMVSYLYEDAVSTMTLKDLKRFRREWESGDLGDDLSTAEVATEIRRRFRAPSHYFLYNHHNVIPSLIQSLTFALKIDELRDKENDVFSFEIPLEAVSITKFDGGPWYKSAVVHLNKARVLKNGVDVGSIADLDPTIPRLKAITINAATYFHVPKQPVPATKTLEKILTS